MTVHLFQKYLRHYKAKRANKILRYVRMFPNAMQMLSMDQTSNNIDSSGFPSTPSLSSLVRRTSVSKSAVLSTSWLPFIRELFLLRLYCNNVSKQILAKSSLQDNPDELSFIPPTRPDICYLMRMTPEPDSLFLLTSWPE